MRDFNKVFGIGISRTGTTSLTAALNHLGITTIHWPRNMFAICNYRGATDITVACRFKELDQMFPNSLFIYTERDELTWLRSVTTHYLYVNENKNLPPGARQFALEADIKIYGGIKPEPDAFAQAYQSHHQSVLAYFKNRPNDLLRLEIAKGKCWEKICSFFDLPIPTVPFPHLNKKPNRLHKNASLRDRPDSGDKPNILASTTS